LGENEACHGVAEGEAGHPCPRLYQVENYALASHSGRAFASKHF